MYMYIHFKTNSGLTVSDYLNVMKFYERQNADITITKRNIYLNYQSTFLRNVCNVIGNCIFINCCTNKT